MKATQAATKTAALKAKKDALERGERTPARVFSIEKKPDGTFSRIAVDPEHEMSEYRVLRGCWTDRGVA